jgi:hypothetical protein
LNCFPKLYFNNVGKKVVPIAGFFTDAAAGTLPNYCLVEPDYGTHSEENPQNIVAGEAFAASVINAVINGPAWDRTLLIWTYDEHGGYYDHVPPPRAFAPDTIPPAVPAGVDAYDGFGRYGFRVPFALVVAVGAVALRVARHLRPHQHPQANRDQVEPPGTDLPGRQRASHAGHARPAPAGLRGPARVRRAAAGLRPGLAVLQCQRPWDHPAPGVSHGVGAGNQSTLLKMGFDGFA